MTLWVGFQAEADGLARFLAGVGLRAQLLQQGQHLVVFRSQRVELVATRAANEIALHILKIALYAAFGLLDSAVLLVGAMVAVAAILAAYVMRWLIPHMAEAPFHFVSTLSMVAAGAAMLFMSSGQIMTIHRAWAQTVRVGEEHEFQLYWGGHRRFVVVAV